MKRTLFAVIILIILSGCSSVSQHREAVQDNSGDKMTVGKVQAEIRIGMSGAEVAEVLGSPNIVSTDEERREVWIYDKIATDTAYSTSRGGISALVLGLGAVVGAAAGGYNQSSGAASKSQRTLTVIIKFDENKKVRDFAYHTSRF